VTKPSANPQAPWSRAKAARRVLTRDADWAEGWIAKLRSACHPLQLAFVDDPGSRVSALCGRGGGKTTGALVRLLQTMGRRRKAPCLFVAVTREHAREIVWDHLKDIVEKLGVDATFNETKLVCTLARNGSTLKLAGADDRKEIDKLRGKSFAGVVIDEAASHDGKLLENLLVRVIGPRLGDLDGWIALIGTPGHQLSGPFYEATRPGGDLHRPYADRDRPEFAEWIGWSSHHWTLKDGAPHVPAMQRLWDEALREKKRQGWSDSHPVWLREYLACWAADDTENVFRYRPHLDDGTPWNVWDPPRVGPLRVAQLPAERDDWMWALAFDKGFSDNFAVNAFAFSPSDPSKTILHVFCFEKPKFYARPLAELLLGEDLSTDSPGGLFGHLGWPVGSVGDTDEAFLAELANVYGVRAVQARRNREFKFGAIELVNGDLVDGRIKVLKGSHLEQQLLQLQWVTNEFGDLKENKAQPNHSTDCLVYGRKLIAHLFESGQVGAEDPQSKRRRATPEERSDSGAQPDGDWSDLLASGTYDEEPW
jgi:hypothetical protein